MVSNKIRKIYEKLATDYYDVSFGLAEIVVSCDNSISEPFEVPLWNCAVSTVSNGPMIADAFNIRFNGFFPDSNIINDAKSIFVTYDRMCDGALPAQRASMAKKIILQLKSEWGKKKEEKFTDVANNIVYWEFITHSGFSQFPHAYYALYVEPDR